MQLDSYLEIFTTYYGWAFANIIGEVITGTGLVVLPFAVIIFDTWRNAKERGLESAGVLPLLEAAQTRLIIAMFVLAVCFATTPVTSLSNTSLTYVPPETELDTNLETGSSTGGTGTTYDDAMRDALDGSFSETGHLSYVPAWWYTIMAVSSGINNAVRNAVSGATSRDLRMVEDMARTATIEDSELLGEIQNFYNQCYLPASRRFRSTDRDDLSPAGQDIIATGNTDYGPSDVDWMGSQLFRTEFYPSMQARNPVAGWVVDYSRDPYCNPADGCDLAEGVANPKWGRPTCQQWWEDPSIGLREKILTQSNWWEKFSVDISKPLFFLNTDQRKDQAARIAVQRSQPKFMPDGIIAGTDYDFMTKIGRAMGNIVSGIGLADQGIKASGAIVPLLTGLPMAQAFVLMVIYMFLPLVVFLSGFSLRAMFYGAVAIFTVKLWSVMWFLAQWIDARMINAMYPGLQGNMFLQEFTHGGAVAQGYQRMIVNILMLVLLVGMPLIWSSMMMWMGWNMGSGLERMASKTEGTSQAASASGIQIASKTAGTAARGIKK